MRCCHCKKREGIYEISDFVGEQALVMVCDECLDFVLGGLESCPTCGYRREDYERTGLMGCADCYRAFLPLTMRETLRLQEKTEHKGKKPEEGNFDLVEERSLLKERIEECIRLRKFAKAHELSKRLDEINRLFGEKGDE